MKRYILLSIIILSFTKLNAQKEPGDDFSVIDIYGDTHNLYSDYLDNNKYVFIDFFTGGCQPCQSLAPRVDTVFRDFGCNYGEIIFLAIDAYGYDYNVWNFTNDFLMSFPAISGNEGGGNDVFTNYGYGMTPYSILIDPTAKIIIDDMEINEAYQLRDSLFKFGFEMQECQGNNFMFYALISENDSIVGNINESNKTIEIEMPFGTDLSSLRAFFRNAVNSEITVNQTEQISGETINDFSSGFLNYQITSETGISEDWTVNIINTSLSEIYENNISIYPNPVEDIFNIKSSINEYKINAEIYSVKGKLLKSINISDNNYSIDISDLSKGIYFIKFSLNHLSIFKKLVKK